MARLPIAPICSETLVLQGFPDGNESGNESNRGTLGPVKCESIPTTTLKASQLDAIAPIAQRIVGSPPITLIAAPNFNLAKLKLT